ncbi:MAG TPA: hypothetical protein VGS41_17290, partial [Chthonomonadales bacterium]|nr:hypothetical protein [Chthonomonadales bacterium]
MRKADAISRRALLHGTAAVGAALALEGTAAQERAEPAPDDPLFAGAAKRIITPDPLLPVSGGMGPTEPTHEKRGELTARALYLRKGETAIAIVSLDLLG